MRSLALVLALAGCHQPLDLNLPYGGGGGGHGGTGSGVDAAAGDALGDGGSAGRVCLAGDARQLLVCAATGAAGLLVTLGTRTATTAADGTFSIVPPSGVATWQVTGTTIVTSEMPLVASATIPALPTTTFDDLANTNGVQLVQGEGSVFVSVTRNNVPLAGATVSASPSPRFATFYDGNSATQWNQNVTGAFSVAWLTGAGVGTVTLTVTPPAGGPVIVPGIVVGDGTNTFIPIDVP